MRVPCPHCGSRGLEEFTFRGDAVPRRPEGAPHDALAPWLAYVYPRANLRGRMTEHWQHSGGCRAWLVVERDTATHEIFSVVDIRDAHAHANTPTATKPS